MQLAAGRGSRFDPIRPEHSWTLCDAVLRLPLEHVSVWFSWSSYRKGTLCCCSVGHKKESWQLLKWVSEQQQRNFCCRWFFVTLLTMWQPVLILCMLRSIIAATKLYTKQPTQSSAACFSDQLLLYALSRCLYENRSVSRLIGAERDTCITFMSSSSSPVTGVPWSSSSTATVIF